MNPQVFLALGSRVAAFLPRAWAESLADAAVEVAAPWLSGARSMTRANLEIALEASVPQQVCKQASRTYARYYLALMRLAHHDPEVAVGPIRLHGDQHVAATRRRGRGAVLVGAHIGNWDVSAIALARRFGGLHIYAEPLRPQRLLEFYERTRARHAVRVLHVGSAGRAPFRLLRTNAILGLAIDRPFGARHEDVPFGGGRLRVATGGLRLALRAEAGIHTIFALRNADGFQVEVGADLSCDLTPGDETARVREVAGRYATALHRVVVRHPEQWCLLYPLVTNAATGEAEQGAHRAHNSDARVRGAA